MSQANQAEQNDSAKKLIEMDISKELYREYEWSEPVSGKRITYRIENPIKVFFYRGCTTHRVVDNKNVAHCVPAIGFYGCVLRWKNSDEKTPVNW
jgi:hypothetical protein